jgi:RNA polymerase sigma-70 factor (ECF subfamily)
MATGRRQSSEQRFRVLIEPHFGALYAAAHRLTRDAADAEDLVQDICLKAFQDLDALESIEYRRAWLLKTLYYRFIDIQRSRDRSPVDRAETGTDSADPERLTEGAMQPDDILEREMRIEVLVRAMEIIGKEASSLLALHDIEGFSFEELGTVTGLPINTIKSRVYRTRAKLGRLLSNEDTHKRVLTLVGGKQ